MAEINVGLISLGCPKNLVDSELMLGLLNNDGFKITSNPEYADVIVVNTCAFIESATQESINTILEMAEFKKGNCKALIVTGCLSQRYNKDIMKELPEVDAVLGINDYDKIANVINDLVKSYMQENRTNNKRISLCSNNDDISYLNGERVISTLTGYAYIKIAEGCDNRCSYCAIPSIRGRYRSRSKEDILNEALKLVKSGIKEIILIAQDTTKYGKDLYGKLELANLLEEICKIEGDFKVRLLYCYPEDLTDELIHVIASNDKILKYIDLPIQHASDKILKLMNRKTNSERIGELIDKIRENITDCIIRTTIIVGFPGETDEDVDNLASFILKYKFDRLGVFTYSLEEGTPAAKLPNHVEESIKQERMEYIMGIQKKISDECNFKRLNRVYDTLIEGVSDDGIFYYGRTYGEAPDIDGVVYFTNPTEEDLEIGSIVKVKMLTYDEYDMIGEVVV